MREFYTQVLDAHLSTDMDETALKALASLDARSEKRKSSDSKEKVATASRRKAVLASLTAEYTFAEGLAESLGLTLGQVRSALSILVREGFAVKQEVKVDKSRKMAYALAPKE
jgi:predicted Rossmann fold nucleotide-binding protein DprA/Smf involved in DNA uptake